MDLIVLQLERVIASLDRLQRSQYTLCSAIRESNDRSARLLESTDRMTEQLRVIQGQNAIRQEQFKRLQQTSEQWMLQGEELNAQIKELQKTSELTAYHAERTQKELAYMNRMDYLTGRNDGPFRNVPPA